MMIVKPYDNVLTKEELKKADNFLTNKAQKILNDKYPNEGYYSFDTGQYYRKSLERTKGIYFF